MQIRDAVIDMVVGMRPDLTPPMVKNAFNTATAVADYAYHYTNAIPVSILDEYAKRITWILTDLVLHYPSQYACAEMLFGKKYQETQAKCGSS